MKTEMLLLWSAVVVYVIAGSIAIVAAILRRRPDRAILAAMVTGLVLHTASLAVRWVRLDHGPFLTMFEILSSNVWSLTLVFAIAYARVRAIRPIAAVVMPVLFVMMGWMLMTQPADGTLPPTYRTVWLFVHIGLGKVFLGAALVAVGIAGVILLRRTRFGAERFARLAPDASLEELAYRFLGIGLVFETLMLIAGAIWAQDAWGRYWAWDPLETWAFVTWLVVAFAIHFRSTVRPAPQVAAVLVIAAFALAFLTFFGVPFISDVPHKGAV